MPTLPLKSIIFQEPVNDLTFPGLGKTAIFKITPGPKIFQMITTLTVVASAAGAGIRTVPRPSWGISEKRFKLGNYNRSRRASELFGVFGMQARNSKNSAGLVQYFQAGAAVTAVRNATAAAAALGNTIGNVPVTIDSADDLLLQAALATNTATTAVFYLPETFAEYFRINPNWRADYTGLPTAVDDGNGNIGSILGTPYFEMDVPAATGVAGTMTGVNLSGSLVYTEDLLAPGGTAYMLKQKVHNAAYAVGDVELAKDFDTKDILQRFLVLCVNDTISKIIVKKGSRIIRQVTFGESMCADTVSEIETGGVVANGFYVDLDQDDNVRRSMSLDPTSKLSIVATFASAGDVPASARILADYWGPVEN